MNFVHAKFLPQVAVSEGETTNEATGAGGTQARTVLHMVGRTRALPHVDFYRQRLDELSWTPWERIDLGIDADQLEPIPVDGRKLMAMHGKRGQGARRPRGEPRNDE